MGVRALDGRVCERHNCSRCCHDTEMDLVPEDIGRIEEAGYRDFHITEGGDTRLRNLKGRCFFLEDDGRCRVYDIRPVGCRLYPLAMRMPGMEPVLDGECPFRDEFRIQPEEVLELVEIVHLISEGRR